MFYVALLLSIVFIISICWGSFLNLVASRALRNKSIFTLRSMCPYCENVIRFYDNIPIISWFILRGKCRDCKKSISILYPLVEILSGFIFTGLFIISFDFMGEFIAYGLALSALIVATRTDLEALVIPQFCTLGMVPVGFFASLFGYTQITWYGSILGALVGYFLPFLIDKIYFKITSLRGIGEGDMELLSFIGSFFGVLGVWYSLIIGSFVGLIVGVSYLVLFKMPRTTRIPFGPFLALGIFIFFFFEQFITDFFLFY